MSQAKALKSLEAVLETFLEQVVTYKQPRLQVLDGINRLDDIARTSTDSLHMTDQIGKWFAANNKLLNEKRLRETDINRISGILSQIRGKLELDSDSPPAVDKIRSEIDRWTRSAPTDKREKIVLRRGPESAPQQAAPVNPDDTDSNTRFALFLDRARDLFADYSGNKKHLLSTLDDTLVAASVQKNKDALILSAFLIYYLKQNGYKVEPFVKRLKTAEELIKGGGSYA